MIDQILTYLWMSIEDNIDWKIVAIVFFSGFFQSYYLKGYTKISDATKTLAVSFTVSTIFMWLSGRIANYESLANFFFSYFMATSMYEILIKPLRRAIENKLNNGLGDQKKPD